MNRSTISTFQLFEMFPDEETAVVGAALYLACEIISGLLRYGAR
jgi:hypothetical protein